MLLFAFILLSAIRDTIQQRDHKFKKLTCYYSLGEPVYWFTLWYDGFDAPKYLRMVVDYHILPSDPLRPRIEDTITHHFVKSDTPCDRQLIFCPVNTPRLRWNVDIYLYLGFRAELFTKFHMIVYGHNYAAPQTILDVSKRYGIGVDLSSFRDYFAQIGSGISDIAVALILYNIASANENICIVTPNEGVVKIRPFYDGGVVQNGHISEIVAKYTLNGKLVQKLRMPAYTCGNDLDISTDAIFIEEIGREAYLQLYTRQLLSFDLTHKNPYVGITETLFTLQHAEFLTIRRIDQVFENKKKVFLMYTNTVVYYCPNRKIQWSNYSPNGIMLYSYEVIEQPKVNCANQIFEIEWPRLQTCMEIWH